MLAGTFDVVGATTEGREAADMARQLDPDVVVLDVDMPGLDGFQTLRALHHSGSPSIPAVFLSMHDAHEMISEAFRCGGRGYVLKSRIARDLPRAIDQALLGRLFAPSLTSLSQLADDGGHALHLHAGVESLIDGVAALFDLALRRGDATCVIATSQVREGLSARLRARGWNAGGPSGHQRYLALDAADGLNRFMRNGVPDPDELALVADELDQFRRAVAGATSRLTVFGTMVAALNGEGAAEATIAVERLWDTLTHGRRVFTLCGYATSCFHSGVPGLWPGVCSQHWAVSHASDV
jgi:CheY-like chemotaxis protein